MTKTRPVCLIPLIPPRGIGELGGESGFASGGRAEICAIRWGSTGLKGGEHHNPMARFIAHSREGSGEHRMVDVNALVEESLSLAWHGARAERQGFNITLERSFDPTAGEADVYPQDITRVLLNLISNGFYAATQRKAETDGGDYEPILAAATRSLGDRVEITIRDNGTGIPPEVKEKIFNPFFTTKPAGEGTGLGLSISHDIIVKQHGGSIEVDTQPGQFTEIRIILPRAA
jgi:two-component system NtrC family sensor kinase